MSRNGQLSLAQAVSSARAFQAEAGPSRTAETNPNRFKAPAHKHAHHLHSIPPREKSTRTLIIDHMLWVHARTRFAQARAELGMTDRTGGPSSSNYTHRRRPENYEEEDEVGSDGEDVLVLKARHEPDDDHAQDLQLAQSLRLRAEGLEKVINSMLVQPPPVHLHFEEDFFVDPNQHMLPNGVRLRLALGTLVNDFFTRQAPPPPFRHKKFAAAGIAASPLATNTSDSSTASPGLLPPALNALVPISAYGQRKAEKRARKRLGSAQSFSSNLSPRTRSLYLAGADPETANSPPTFRCPRHLHTGCEICVEAKQDFSVKGTGGKGKARERSASTAPTPGSTFAAPSWPSTSSSNPSASSSNPNPSAPIGIAPDGGGISGFQDPSAAGGCSVGVGEGLLKPSLNGSVLRRRTAAPYTRRTRGGGGEVEADSTGSGYTKLSELLPRFLRLSALVLMELGREVYEGREGQDEREENEREERGENGSGGEGREDSTVTNSPNSPTMTKQGVGGRAMPDNYSYTYTLTPSREWYHLLAGILTRAALQGYLTAGWRGVNAVECLMGLGLGIDLQRFLPARTEDSSRTRGSDRAPSTTYSTGAPSTRAPSTRALSMTTEGNTGDDMDTRASSSSADEGDAEAEAEQEPDMFTEDEDLYKEFNPDEMPSLHQAVAILFPSLGLGASLDDAGEGDDRGSGGEERGERGGAGRGDRDSGYGGDRGEGGQGGVKSGDKRQSRRERASPAEAEFMGEMSERLRKFMEIPDSTPDLSTHMEDLAWRYPAEPMERAAARFCEAIASWRGKPELEGYKKRPPKTWPSTSSPNGTRASFSIPMTMESLVHSNPVSPTIPTISRSQPQVPPQSPSQSQTQPASTKKPSIDVYFIHPDRDPSGYPVSLSSFSAGPSGRAAPPNQSQSHRISASPVLSSLSPYPTTNSRRQSFHSTPKSSSSPYSLPALSQSPRSANAYPHPNSNSNSNQTSFQRRTSSSPTSNPNPNPIPLLNHSHAHNQNQNQNQPSPSSSSAGGFSYYSGPQGNTSAMTSTMNSAMNSTPSPSSTSAMLQHQHQQQQQQQQQQYAHSHSSHAIGAQQIPVWNAATGAWMPPPPPPTISGGKRMRSPERGGSMGMGMGGGMGRDMSGGMGGGGMGGAGPNPKRAR
ncbi:hypothetical protein BDP27DRAFT_1433491 [Rhodocollybia butyracea]|uniref:Uncharacterized protein n=1 Tax=Rhodocollybia butyracea TaxID=206335 RepID=A0A9P5P708_9AGAR|nr:hypothetical protein BDP27DRAFT_1433491 [Rhodocollybia butyracea]